MRIELVRSGGVTGVLLRVAVETNDLPTAEAEHLEGLLDGLDLPALAVPAQAPTGPDRFQYDLLVDRGGEPCRLSFGEPTLPDELRPIIETLLRRARHRAD